MRPLLLFQLWACARILCVQKCHVQSFISSRKVKSVCKLLQLFLNFGFPQVLSPKNGMPQPKIRVGYQILWSLVLVTWKHQGSVAVNRDLYNRFSTGKMHVAHVLCLYWRCLCSVLVNRDTVPFHLFLVNHLHDVPGVNHAKYW